MTTRCDRHRRRTDARIGASVVLVALLLSGCASPFDDEPFKEWTDADTASWRHAGPASPDGTHGATTSARRVQSVDALPADAGPEDYVAIALRRNPSLIAAQHNVLRLRERIPQATSLDDPLFQVAPIGEQAQTAAGQVELMAGVSQKLPFPGKLGTRGRIADQDVSMATADLEQTRLAVRNQTVRAYWSLYTATRDIEVTRASRDLLAQFMQSAEANYRAGTAQQQDVLRVSVELHNLDKQLHTLDQSRATAEAMLNRLMDRPVTAQLPDPPEASIDVTSQDLERFLAEAAASNPSLTRSHEQIEQYRQRLRLARLNRWPDLTVGVQYNAVGDGLAASSNGEDQWWLAFGVNLPIWLGKHDAAEREAHQGMMQSLAELHAMHNGVDFDVREAFDRMQTHHHHVALLRDKIVPEAKQAVDAAMSQYRAGGGDFLTVIDDWRRMLEFERMLYSHQAMYQQAAADLQQAVGGEMPGTSEIRHE